MRFSHKFTPSGKEGNLGDYIAFHIENYMIRSRAVYDRVLIFTNFLCGIGMPKERINHNAIVTNQKVIKFGLEPKLKSINRTDYGVPKPLPAVLVDFDAAEVNLRTSGLGLERRCFFASYRSLISTWL